VSNLLFLEKWMLFVDGFFLSTRLNVLYGISTCFFAMYIFCLYFESFSKEDATAIVLLIY
jgi:hypothetical protein